MRNAIIIVGLMAIAVVASALLVGCANRSSYQPMGCEECSAGVKQVLGREGKR